MEQDNKFIKSLIESAQNGKVVALEELYKMNIDRIYAIALRLTGNGPLAGLLVQNVLINAWQQLKRIRADVLFADWLKSMTIYDTLGELRKGKLQNDKKSIKQFKEDGKADSHFHEPLEKAISELQDNQRIVVVLNLIENYSISEIGDLLSLSETETQNILENAVQKIVESVSKKAPDTKVTELIKNLPTEIQPHTEIIPWVLEFIREVKTEEFKEAEKTVREEEEPPEEKDEEELERERKKERKKEKEKVKEKKLKKEKRKTFVSIIWVVATVIVIVAAYYIITLKKPWSISGQTGNYTINNEINPGSEISQEEILFTKASSSVYLTIPGVGKLKLLSNTTLKRLDEKNTAQLISGKLIVNNTGAVEKFKLLIPDAIIEDYQTGDSYYVEVDEKENSFIKLSSGWIRVQSTQGESIFPQGFELKIVKGKGMDVPYSSNADPVYVTQLDEYLFNGKRLNVLSIIISKTSTKDALTLWNLFKRVDESHRVLVYNKLAELVSPPSSTNQNGLLNLNQEMMQAWFEEIKMKM